MSAFKTEIVTTSKRQKPSSEISNVRSHIDFKRFRVIDIELGKDPARLFFPKRIVLDDVNFLRSRD